MTAKTEVHPEKAANGEASKGTAASAASSGASKNGAALSVWYKRLFTHEDPQNVHKTMGFLVLASYVFRIAQVGASDMGFATHPEWTLPTLLLHFALNATSFVFHIPVQRINTGYRIWPEYRLHSMVFLSRSLLLLLLVYLEDTYKPSSPQYRLDSNLLVALATMAAADLCSNSQGKYRSSTIRGFETPAAVKYFFSVMQMYATGGCILGIARYSTQFVFVMIIQLNAFLMTIRRKNLASHNLLIFLYGAMLTIGFFVCDYEHRYFGPSPYTYLVSGCIAHTASVLRLGPRWPLLKHIQNNKYLLWGIIGLLVRQLRPFLDNGDPQNGRMIGAYWVVSLLGVIVIGALKHLKKTKPVAETKKED